MRNEFFNMKKVDIILSILSGLLLLTALFYHIAYTQNTEIALVQNRVTDTGEMTYWNFVFCYMERVENQTGIKLYDYDI